MDKNEIKFEYVIIHFMSFPARHQRSMGFLEIIFIVIACACIYLLLPVSLSQKEMFHLFSFYSYFVYIEISVFPAFPH